MRKYIFYLFWLVTALMVVLLSMIFRDGRQAMVAEVESRVSTISFPKAVKIKKLHVVPGQDVQKGSVLVELHRAALALDMVKVQNELESVENRVFNDSLDHQLAMERLRSSYLLDKKKLDYQKEVLQARQKVEAQTTKQVQKILEASSEKTTSLLSIELDEIASRLTFLRQAYDLKVITQKQRYSQRQKEQAQERAKVQLRLSELEEDQVDLIQRASYDGTIGNVFVELDEIVEPYKKILSLYEARPTLIKAYTSERETQTLSEGQAVKVTSTNREYEVDGVIEALGSRVTSYPDKIRPNQNLDSYGREVFIRIQPDNQFLNGEKVYVYPIIQKQ